MDNELTVIYYTSNQEKPGFEEKIRQTLLETIGDLPLISVSQKPMDFGKNICVGDVGVSGQNAHRQLQIGAIEANTKFVCIAESDFLYPKEYFEFRPKNPSIGYLITPVWVLISMRGKAKVFVKKHRGCQGALVVGRHHLIGGIEDQLQGLGTWGDKFPNGSTFRYLLNVLGREYQDISIPSITFKTDEQMHRKTPHDPDSKCRELPYWGTAKELLDAYL